MASQVDTRATSDYRTLRFDSIDACGAEIHRILAADEDGTLRATGNWTPGQIMAHVASWIEYGYDGFPIGPPPFFVRWILRLRLRKMLEGGMPRGVRIPRVEKGTVGMDDMELSAAAERLLNALQRLKNRDEAKFDSPAFGPMSHDDRIKLNLRHAELHIGFFAY
jgi:hypothetical protein